ncbi:uncharacterized protein LOC132606977 isoform X4 [Lycium barbarum]|uniref:uncharacterized protein LOC132606977 isoform X4 n=1 Tax=Lycium barbarum TaxID=112863 RepID=UPI00293E0346|nr:uncharacterized protein LOC132606977 isoform X4 [Lycium barbarum]
MGFQRMYLIHMFIMDVKVCLFLVILGVVCCTARELAAPDLLIKEKTEDVSGNVQAQRQLQPLKDASGSKGLCTLCEEYTATALGYLANNKTQAKILGLLLQTCSQMPIYKHEEVVSISQQFSQNGCDLCHQVVRETLSKLKDPDTQLDILELLLKACGSVEKYANKCKKMVFEYAPVILINMEHFLEKNDVCTILHACEPAVSKEEALPEMQSSLHSAS